MVKKVRLPQFFLSVAQRLSMHEAGITGGLEGGPWLWPVPRNIILPTRRPYVDSEVCNKCGLCIMYCPEGIIFKSDKGIEIDYQFCKGCLICVNECKRKAMKVME